MPGRPPRLAARAALLEELERRILLSADAPASLLGAGLAGADPSPPAWQAEHELEAAAATRRELVFVDPGVAGWQALVADLRAAGASDRAIDVVVLDPTRDGVDQIGAALRTRGELDAIHVLAHGSAGAMRLGDGWLDATRLARDADAIAAWGDALNPDGDLLLYGCDLAASPEGASLLEALARITDADVAASVDATGSAVLGGNWELEARAGSIEAQVPFSASLREQWSGLLAIESIADDFSSGGYAGNTGTESWAGPWREIGELTDPGSGIVQVSGGALRIGGNGISIQDSGVVREADLDGVIQATLHFDYRRQNLSGFGGSVSVQVSRDGASWTTLATYNLTGATDASFVAQSFDVTAWAGPEMQLRFLGAGTARGYLYVDDVALEYSRTLYLKGDGVPSASLAIAAPPAVALPNYDPGRDSFPGLMIDKGGSGLGETDPVKHQIWRAPVDAVDRIDARVQFTFHSAMKDFDTGKRGSLTAFLVDAQGSTLTAIASATLQVDDWGEGGWQQFTVDFGDVSYDLAPGHQLAIKIIVSNTSQDTLWFAYDTQTYASQLAFLPSTPSQSTGAAVWANNTGTPQVSLWDGAAFGPQSGTSNLSTRWRIIQGAEAPTRDERIVAGVDTGGVIRGQLWNGSVWSPLPINPLGTMSTSAYWGVDVAYESQSGDAVLVWGNGTTGSASLSYSVWNGSSWSAPATIAVPVAGAAHQLQLAASPTSDGMVLIVSTAGSQDYALVWNGSSWGNAITLSATGTGNDRTDVYVAYEQRSGDALVVYGRGTSAVHFRTWNGTAWSGEGTLGAPAGAAGNARWTTLGADATSDRIALGVLTYSGHVWLSVWSGSAWQAPVLASTAAASTTAPGVAVAFEATTGQALAVYTASGSPYTRYRTWTPAGGWSGAGTGTFVGNVPRSVMLDADPATDDIMLSIVDDGADFNLARWNGAGWSERTELSSNTFETGLQPFVFLWDRKLNAPPVLDLPGGSIDYVENDPAMVLDGAATVGDPDSPDFAGGSLTVRFGAGGTPDDRLALRDQGPGLGNVSLSGNVVSYDFGAGPVAIGSYTGGGDGSTPLVVTFNANASATVVQAVARNVTYRNVSDGPVTAPRTVEMVVTDGDGGTSAPAFKTVTVTALNDPPSLADVVFSLPENSADGTLVGALAAVDPDLGENLVYAITGGNAGGAFAIDASTGAITVANAAALDFETTPSFALTVQVTDAGGLTDSATVTVDLTNVNEAPVLADASFSLAENSANGTLVGSVAATDPDVGDTRSYAITGGNLGGAFAIDANTGAITVTNAAALDFETTPSFALTVQVTDAGGLTDTATVTVDLTNVNEAPVLADASFSLPENSANGTLVGSVAATDPDAGDTRSYAITGGNLGGAFAIDPNTGAITVANVAALDFEATPSFALTVRVTDAGGLTDTATITVGLTNVNEAPVLADASFSLPENSANGTLVGAVTASDPDAGEALAYAITGGNAGGAFAIDPNTGAITVANAAALDFEATPGFVLAVQVTDTGGLTDTATVTVDLTNVNEAPVLADASFSLPENSANGTLVGSVAATDPDVGDTRSYAVTGGNLGGAFTIDANTGAITVADAAALDFEATPSFALTVQATDAGGLTGTATVTVNLTNVNEAPVLADASFSLAENSANGTLVGSVVATDPDAGDTRTYAITAGNGSGAFTIDANTGAITVADAAALDFETTPSFALTVQATDAGGLTDTATVTVTLTNVNEAPVLADASFSLPENSGNGTLVGAVTASDPDAGDTLSYAITGGNAGGAFAIDPNTGAITVANVAALDFETTSSFALTVQATDAGGLTDTATVTVDLTNVNEAPVLADASFSLSENSANGTLVGSVAATDPDAGDTRTYAITGGNAGGAFAIDANTGAITVANVAALDFEATPSFALTVQATDAGGLADTATVTVTLTNVNEAPALADASFSLAESSPDGTPVGSVAAVDPDAGDALVYAITGGNAGGAFAIDPNTGAITVANTAALDFETMPSFALTVQVTDAGGLSDTATVSIAISDANEAPSLADASFSLPENSANGTLVGSVVATDPDAGDTRTYAITAGNGSGAFTIDANTGAITVADAAALDFEATPSFALTVQVTDAGGLTDTATVTVDLTNVNEAPVLADASFSLPENSANGTLVGSVAATDPDAGDTRSYAITGGNLGGAFTIDANTGAITVADAAALDFEATPSFALTVQVTDAGGLTDTATVTVDLTNVNEAPVLADASFSLPEDSANGMLVGSVAATDPDAGDTRTYAITGGNAGGAFAIDPNTGAITVANAAALDFEATPSFALTVQVTDAGGLTDTATVTVDLTNVNEAPVLADASFSLAENSANGTLVGALAAADPDAGEALSYAITGGNAGGAFAIDPSTGAITVANAAALDFEATPSFALTVQVTDAGGLTDTATVTVDLTNVNEAPVLADASFSLAENSANGTLVGALAAADPDAGDTLSYAITGGNAGGAFAIDPSTGAITVANAAALDFETTPSFALTVQVTDAGGLTDSATVTVDLTNVNEAPVLADASFSLPENSANGTLVGSVAATDPDAGDTRSYAITGGNLGGAFAIDANTGAITVANVAALDFEATPSFALTVQVTDAGGLTDTATVTVTLTNVNEAPVLVDASFSLPENGASGTPIGSVAATDPDVGDTLSYAITGGNAGGAFAIDPNTGAITVANAAALDFETTSSLPLTVRVTDAGGLSDTATVRVTLTDVNEPPVLADASFSLPEGSAAGTLVGTLVAVDPDAGDAVRYAITSGNAGGAFAIDPGTGAITVANAAALDLDTTPSFVLTVEAADASGAAQTATITVSLREAGPVVDAVELRDPPVHEPEEPEDELPVETFVIPPTPRAPDAPVLPPSPRPRGPGEHSGYELAKPRPLPEVWQAPAVEEGSVRDHHLGAVEQPGMIDQRRLLEALDRLRQDLSGGRSADEAQGFTLSIQGVALMISSGLLALLMRGGSLAAAALSSLPLWRRVDPLAVLALSEAERWQREQDIRAAQREEESGRLLDAPASREDERDGGPPPPSA